MKDPMGKIRRKLSSFHPALLDLILDCSLQSFSNGSPTSRFCGSALNIAFLFCDSGQTLTLLSLMIFLPLASFLLGQPLPVSWLF